MAHGASQEGLKTLSVSSFPYGYLEMSLLCPGGKSPAFPAVLCVRNPEVEGSLARPWMAWGSGLILPLCGAVCWLTEEVPCHQT